MDATTNTRGIYPSFASTYMQVITKDQILGGQIMEDLEPPTLKRQISTVPDSSLPGYPIPVLRKQGRPRVASSTKPKALALLSNNPNTVKSRERTASLKGHDPVAHEMRLANNAMLVLSQC